MSSMKTKHRENLVHEAVSLGLMEIDLDGRIWKVAELRGNRWNDSALRRSVTRRRAEHYNGHYLQVRRMAGAKRFSCLAHRLVWFHFNGPIPQDLTINHKNGIKTDNMLSNLELTTYSENMRHAYRIGLIDEHGEKNPAAKLTDAEVLEIRHRYASGKERQAQLATEFGVTFQTISNVVRGNRRPRQGGPTANYIHLRQRTPHIRNKLGQFHSA